MIEVHAYGAQFKAYIKAEIDRVWREWPPGPRRYEQVYKLANAWDALTVALNSGMRRADIAAFLWISVRDGAIIYTPGKSRTRAKTAKKKPRVVVLPILRDMARLLARRGEIATGPRVIWPYGQDEYTSTSLGRIVADVSKSDAIDTDRHLHDGKGSFVTQLRIETDLTDQEIASLVDWSVANVQSIIRTYVSAAAVSDALLKRFKRKA